MHTRYTRLRHPLRKIRQQLKRKDLFRIYQAARDQTDSSDHGFPLQNCPLNALLSFQTNPKLPAPATVPRTQRSLLEKNKQKNPTPQKKKKTTRKAAAEPCDLCPEGFWGGKQGENTNSPPPALRGSRRDTWSTPLGSSHARLHPRGPAPCRARAITRVTSGNHPAKMARGSHLGCARFPAASLLPSPRQPPPDNPRPGGAPSQRGLTRLRSPRRPPPVPTHLDVAGERGRGAGEPQEEQEGKAQRGAHRHRGAHRRHRPPPPPPPKRYCGLGGATGAASPGPAPPSPALWRSCGGVTSRGPSQPGGQSPRRRGRPAPPGGE